MTKLTVVGVLAIKKKLAEGNFLYRDLAEEHGVAVGTIKNIRKGDIWGWVTLDDAENPKPPKRITPRGELNGRCKLTESQVHQIRRLGLSGINNRLLSDIYGVSSQTVNKIKNGHSWAWLKDE